LIFVLGVIRSDVIKPLRPGSRGAQRKPQSCCEFHRKLNMILQVGRMLASTAASQAAGLGLTPLHRTGRGGRAHFAHYSESSRITRTASRKSARRRAKACAVACTWCRAK